MGKYKIGDIAASLPVPKVPETESGKKLLSLFGEFQKKKKDDSFSKKKKKADSFSKKKEIQVEDTPKQNLSHFVDANSSIKKSVAIKKKRKFSQTIESAQSEETSPVKNDKKATDSLKKSNFSESFPRRKKNKRDHVSVQNNRDDSINFKNVQNHSSSINIEITKNLNSPVSNLTSKSKGKNQIFQTESEDSSDESDSEKEVVSKKLKKNKTQKAQESPLKFNEEPQEFQNFSKNVSDLSKKAKMKPSNRIEDSETNKKIEDPEKSKRTIFIGNLPKHTHKKALLKHFRTVGSVESVRFRGLVPKKDSISKRVASITKTYHEGVSSIKGFIVFKDQEHAEKAVKLNGTLFEGNHIIVDLAHTSKDNNLYEDKRTIFIGNLPFNVEDETVWNAFSNCGEIERIRIIRDSKTGLGKGFGYVLFASIASKQQALTLEDFEIDGRKIRIQPIQSKDQASKKHDSKQVISKQEFNMFRQNARKIKKKMKDEPKRKSTKKIMKKQKDLWKKKKIARIMQNV